ncbi:MAG: 30S ribosomal protein S20 [Robiginitomaculum sp.]|nr:MAG: 30S ribosomal protein S20 [Robiginitomaculum sp.]
MANTSSAKKAVRQIARRTAVNKSRRTNVRSTLRVVEEAITSGDQPAAKAAFAVAEPTMMRAVSKGVFHKNTAARKISRLSQRIKALGTK